MARRNITQLQLSPAAAPPSWSPQKQDDELQFLRDRHYFMHGEIIAFTAITVFVIFLLFLVIPCVRRTVIIPNSTSETSESSSKKGKYCLLFMLRRKRKADDDHDHEQHPWPPESFDEKNSVYV